MTAFQNLVEQAKRLPVEERRRLVSELRASLKDEHARQAPHRMAEPYSEWLELAGAFHSDHADVSSHKGKHLRNVFYPRRDET